jgi:hypothetical protein
MMRLNFKSKQAYPSNQLYIMNNLWVLIMILIDEL